MAPTELSQRPPLARVIGVTKSFGGVRALRHVDLEVYAGEVHALLGENGAGKSTLIKILSGVHPYDEGSVELDGKQVVFHSPAQARDSGVAVVYQDLSLVGSLSVAANLMLGREPRTSLGFLKKRQLARDVEEFLALHKIPLDPRAQVGNLPFAYRQMTEICKALMGKARILILDEPTSALAGDEERILFEAIRAATAKGVGVLYVTHRLNEVFRIADRVTVLRDGANVGSFATSETDMKQLVGTIVGPGHGLSHGHRNAADEVAASTTWPKEGLSAGPVLEMSEVTADGLYDIDLALGEGEIHGLAGLVGSGRTELLEAIFGLRPLVSGRITLNGAALNGHSPAEAIGHGIALVPEDRQVQGLVLDHSIERNLTLPRLSHFSRWGWLMHGASVRQAEASMRALNVKAPGPMTAANTLSGGNQQKVVFAKWSRPRPCLLLLDEPTVGVDVGARDEIYALIREVARSGAAVLVVSSDLAELLLLCDRMSIVAGGHIVGAVARGELHTVEELHHVIQAAQPSAEPVA